MKKRLAYYTLHALGFILILLLLSGYVENNSLIALVIYSVIWGFVTKISVFVYKFFLLSENIITYVVAQSIVNVGYLYLLELLAPAINFVGGGFEGVNGDLIVIKSQEISGVYSIIISSVALAFASYYFNYLVKSK